MRRPVRLCWVLPLLLISGGPAIAWNDTGHMIAARLTYRQLPEDLQVRFGEVLAEHPRYREDFLARLPAGLRGTSEQSEWLFARASTWPDLARHFGHVRPARAREGLVERFNRGRWHYVNQPLQVDARGLFVASRLADPLTRGAPSDPAERHVVEAIDALREAWPAAAAAERAIALCWVLHLTADLHQPLHTVALFAPGRLESGDRGGNEIRVGGIRGRTNLHALWDGAMGGSADWNQLTGMLEGLSASAVESDPINLRAWAKQGKSLAREVVYVSEVRAAVSGGLPFAPGEAYQQRMRDTARSQLALAARRLVGLLSNLSTLSEASRAAPPEEEGRRESGVTPVAR